MSNPFVGEVKIFAGNFAPRGYAACNGQILAIQQNTALFSLLGTTYGGNGTSNFGLPNLQASVPLGSGTGPGLSDRLIGDVGGSANVTLTPSAMPAHQHVLQAYTGRLGSAVPAPTAGASLGASGGGNLAYAAAGTPVPVAMASNVLTPGAGSSAAHNNVMPSLAVFFIVALVGVYPARN